MSTGKHQISDAGVITRGENYHPGYVSANDLGSRKGIVIPRLTYKDFGAVATASANAISLSQSVTSGVAFLLNGANAGVMDVPRNVVAAWTTTAILTIVGLDEYGVVMTEASASGTAHTGKKAFKSITSITPNANITLATVGTGDVLGLPFSYANKSQIISPTMDGVADAVTMVIADATDPATTTTGDVRGTVDYTTASNGTRRFAIMQSISASDGAVATFGVAQV